MAQNRMRLLGLLGGLLATGAALPARGESIGILDLRFEGLAPAVVEPVRRRVQDTLTGLGYRVVDQVTTLHLLKEGPPGCSVGPCLARVGQVVRVGRVLIGTVSSLGSSYELSFSMLETSGGTVVAQVNQRCDVCNFQEVETAAGRVAEALHRQAQVVIALRSSVSIASVPPGALVVIDGLPHGPAPVHTLLTPGRHTVEGVAKDLPPLARHLEVNPGEVRRLTLNLVERSDELRTVTSPSGRRYPGWLKWTMFAGGLALVGPGAVLWAVDGRPSADDRTLLESRPAGIALVSIGGAALIAGTVLTVLERR